MYVRAYVDFGACFTPGAWTATTSHHNVALCRNTRLSNGGRPSAVVDECQKLYDFYSWHIRKSLRLLRHAHVT